MELMNLNISDTETFYLFQRPTAYISEMLLISRVSMIPKK